MARIGRFFAYGLLALALLVVAAALILPLLLDTPRMRATIQAKLSQAVQGEVRWERFSLRLIPAPRTELRGLHVRTPKATLSADEVDLALAFWPLLLGRPEITSVSVVRPQLSFAGAPRKGETPPSDEARTGALRAYRAAVGALVDGVRRFAPQTTFALEHAAISLRLEGMPPVDLSEIDVRAKTAADAVELQASAASPYWSAMKLSGRIHYANLASTADLDLQGAKAQAWLDWLLADTLVGVELPDAEMRARFEGDADKALTLQLDASAPSLGVVRGPRRTRVEAVHLEGSLAADENALALHLADASLGAVRLSAGELRYLPKDKALTGEAAYVLELAPIAEHVRRIAPEIGDRIKSASGALRGRMNVTLGGGERRVVVSVEDSDAALDVRDVPGPVRLERAVVDIDARAMKIERAALSVPAGRFVLSTLRYSPAERSGAVKGDFDLDLERSLAVLKGLLPKGKLDFIASAGGRARGSADAALEGSEWRADVELAHSDAQVQLSQVPSLLRIERASVRASEKAVVVERGLVSMPAGQVQLEALRYSLENGSLAARAQFDFDLARALAVARGALPKGKLDVVEAASGRARGSAEVALSRKDWRAGLDLARSAVQVKLRGLPAPAQVSGLAVRATPREAKIESVHVALLDGSASAAAAIGLGKELSAKGSVSEAILGPKLVEWLWQAGKIPAGFAPRAPIRLVVPHLAWGPKQALDVQARAQFESGPALGVDLGWAAGALDVRRAAIKDQHSDVAVSLKGEGAVLEGRYAGKLDGRTLAALLKAGPARAGTMDGDLRFRIDRDEPRRSSAEGTLQAENLDLSWLAGKPAKLERLEVTAAGDVLHIGQAAAEWAGQRATLVGSVTRSAEGPVIDATIDSPGILVDALLPEKKPSVPEKPKAKTAKTETPKAKALEIWPLPATGKVALRTPFVQSGHLKVAPVSATLTLERERAHLELAEGQLCGIALPFTLDATPQGFAAAARLSAKKLPIDQSVKCLSAEKVLLTGALDMNAELRTEGKADVLLKNLKGTVNADLRNGQVMKFALIGNILSMRNVVALAEQGGPKLGAEGFPFRQLSAKGHFKDGYFMLDEGVFYSNAIGLGANGWVSLSDYQSRLTVLVAPLALLTETIRKLPLLGYVIGGTFTSLPVAVSGDIRDPLVVPLGPSAITSELTGIISRTLTLPGQLAPSAPPAPKR